jgi:hypothetical protein
MRGQWFFAALLAFIFAGSAGAQTPEVKPESIWSEYKSPERGFSIAFPTAPEISSGSVAGLNPLMRYSFRANDGDETVYTVVVLEYPSGKAPKSPGQGLFSQMVEAYARNSESRVRKKGPKQIGERDGYEAIADDAKGRLSHSIGLVPASDRIYMLISAGPQGHATSPSAQRFRDSFRVLGSEAEADRVHTAPAR